MIRYLNDTLEKIKEDIFLQIGKMLVKTKIQSDKDTDLVVKGIAYLKKAILIAEPNQNRQVLAEANSYMALGTMKTSKGYTKAIIYGNKAIIYALQSNIPTLRLLADSVMMECYRKCRDFKHSFIFSEDMRLLSDSISEKIKELHSAERALEIDTNQIENRDKLGKISEYGFIASIIAGIFLFIFYKTVVRKNMNIRWRRTCLYISKWIILFFTVFVWDVIQRLIEQFPIFDDKYLLTGVLRILLLLLILGIHIRLHNFIKNRTRKFSKNIIISTYNNSKKVG